MPDIIIVEDNKEIGTLLKKRKLHSKPCRYRRKGVIDI